VSVRPRLAHVRQTNTRERNNIEDKLERKKQKMLRGSWREGEREIGIGKESREEGEGEE